LEGGLDRADGLLLFGGGLRERSEDDGLAVFDSGLLDDSVFDSGRDEGHGDIRVGLAGFGLVEAGDGEVEAVAVVGFAVDLDGSGGCHGVWIFGFKSRKGFLWKTTRRWRWILGTWCLRR